VKVKLDAALIECVGGAIAVMEEKGKCWAAQTSSVTFRGGEVTVALGQKHGVAGGTKKISFSDTECIWRYLTVCTVVKLDDGRVFVFCPLSRRRNTRTRNRESDTLYAETD
jgi:hypothetical protein